MSDRASGDDRDRTRQVDRLRECLSHNPVIAEILQKAPSFAMTNWYLGAGCIAQTVWSSLHGFAPTLGIKDYDLVYHDASDLWLETQTRYQGACDRALRPPACHGGSSKRSASASLVRRALWLRNRTL
jgi:hypothetical protein